jgi:hypothetical protein
MADAPRRVGSAPRGRQTIISYGWARLLDRAPRDAGGVPDCGLAAMSHLNAPHELLRLALGWAWNELPLPLASWRGGIDENRAALLLAV